METTLKHLTNSLDNSTPILDELCKVRDVLDMHYQRTKDLEKYEEFYQAFAPVFIDLLEQTQELFHDLYNEVRSIPLQRRIGDLSNDIDQTALDARTRMENDNLGGI